MEIVVKLVMAMIVSFILYTYLLYPVILFFLGIFKRTPRFSDPFELPTVALIISAHNEERIIREKLENSLQIDYPRELLRIIVASDGSIAAKPVSSISSASWSATVTKSSADFSSISCRDRFWKRGRITVSLTLRARSRIALSKAVNGKSGSWLGKFPVSPYH